MKYRQIIRLIERDGWVLARTRGSHRHYKHPTKPGVVTVAAHLMGNDVPTPIANFILKKARLK